MPSSTSGFRPGRLGRATTFGTVASAMLAAAPLPALERDLNVFVPQITEWGLTQGSQLPDDGAIAVGRLVPTDADPDFVIGAPIAGPTMPFSSGRVQLWRGRFDNVLDGLEMFPMPSGGPNQAPHRTFNGVAADDRFGASLAVGDVNGDGKDDMVVLAARRSPISGPTRAGEIYLWLGPLDTAPETPTQTIFGSTTDDFLNEAKSLRIADLTGDGKAEIIIGAPGHSGPGVGVGAVYILAGSRYAVSIPPTRSLITTPPEITFLGESANDQLGAFVGAGDATGDGRLDLVMGATGINTASSRGRVYLYSGVTIASLTLPPVVINLASPPPGGAPTSRIEPSPASSMRSFGADVAVAELTHDGIADLLVGAPGNHDAVVLSGPLAANISLEGTGSTPCLKLHHRGDFGRNVEAADVNDDGNADLIIGAPLASGPSGSRSEAGELWVLCGPVSCGSSYDMNLSDGKTVYIGKAAGDRLGAALTTGDITGFGPAERLEADGIADILVGAPRASSPNGANSGEMYVLAGQPVAPRITCPPPFGECTSSAGCKILRDFCATADNDDCDASPDLDVTWTASGALNDGPNPGSCTGLRGWPVGSTQLTFTATDSDGHSSSCSTRMVIASAAVADICPPGPDPVLSDPGRNRILVCSSSSVQLDGTCTTPDVSGCDDGLSDNLQFQWEILNPAECNGSFSPSPNVASPTLTVATRTTCPLVCQVKLTVREFAIPDSPFFFPCSSVAYQEIQFGDPPDADFDLQILVGDTCPNNVPTVRYLDESDRGDCNLPCSWNFGDGQTSSTCGDQLVNYQSCGKKMPSLTITDGGPCHDTEAPACGVCITGCPVVDFSQDADEGHPGHGPSSAVNFDLWCNDGRLPCEDSGDLTVRWTIDCLDGCCPGGMSLNPGAQSTLTITGCGGGSRTIRAASVSIVALGPGTSQVSAVYRDDCMKKALYDLGCDCRSSGITVRAALDADAHCNSSGCDYNLDFVDSHDRPLNLSCHANSPNNDCIRDPREETGCDYNGCY